MVGDQNVRFTPSGPGVNLDVIGVIVFCVVGVVVAFLLWAPPGWLSGERVELMTLWL